MLITITQPTIYATVARIRDNYIAHLVSTWILTQRDLLIAMQNSKELNEKQFSTVILDVLNFFCTTNVLQDARMAELGTKQGSLKHEAHVLGFKVTVSQRKPAIALLFRHV